MKTAKTMFNFLQIEKEHEKMFPMATPRSQILKLNEEFHEYQQATSIDEAYQEYGDFLIVCISLRRFPETQLIAESLLEKYYFSYPIEEQKILMKYLQIAVFKIKMRVENKEYYFKDGLYDRVRKGGKKDVKSF